MKAVLRGIRITPKKANLVAGMVRGKTVKQALAMLKFMPKKGAHIIAKVIKSAAFNAKNNFSQSIDDLVISEIWAVKGPTLKRGTPANRGRMWPIHEVMSHITVVVASMSGATPKKPSVPAKSGSAADGKKATKASAKTNAEAKSPVSEKTETKAEKKEKKPAKKPAKKESK